MGIPASRIIPLEAILQASSIVKRITCTVKNPFPHLLWCGIRFPALDTSIAKHADCSRLPVVKLAHVPRGKCHPCALIVRVGGVEAKTSLRKARTLSSQPDRAWAAPTPPP
jgi:hypothetical protein